MFQFLYGTIKSCDAARRACTPPRFQFLYGTIKSHVSLRIRIQVVGFNSCMVQLKEDLPDHYPHRTQVSIPVWYN